MNTKLDSIRNGFRIPGIAQDTESVYPCSKKNSLNRILGRYTGIAGAGSKRKITAQHYRISLQAFFLIITISIGYRFGMFVASLSDPSLPAYDRPPGVEAFLPISSLISFKQLIDTGEFTTVHPSGLVIFLIILATGLFLKRAFCSTMCPVGTFSEFLAFVNRLVFKKPVRLPGWLDFPLRGIKYMLLAFFSWAILMVMSPSDTSAFIDSPYNRVADIKMMLFFTDMTPFALKVLAVLVVLSALVPYSWCRYLCPYGALMGFLSLFSPIKVQRNSATCTNCKACTRVCPASITVHKLKTVTSDECHACMKCIDSCPVKNTLYINAPFSRKTMKPAMFFITLAVLFVSGIGIAVATGHWRNDISREEYLTRYQDIDNPIYQHNRGQVVYEEH
jgi:polyferredoxin